MLWGIKNRHILRDGKVSILVADTVINGILNVKDH